MNGTENTNVDVINGDPKNNSDCDISSSSNTKIVSNGINSDSDDTKSSKSDENNDIGVNPDLNLTVFDTKSVSSKKKENKKISSEKQKDADKKNSKTDNSVDDKKDDESLKTLDELDKDKDKTDDEDSKIVNGDKERESSPSEDGDEKKRDAEVVFIQDMGFTVKIVSPRAEPLDIQVFLSFLLYFILTVYGCKISKSLFAGFEYGTRTRDTSSSNGS